MLPEKLHPSILLKFPDLIGVLRQSCEQNPTCESPHLCLVLTQTRLLKRQPKNKITKLKAFIVDMK